MELLNGKFDNFIKLYELQNEQFTKFVQLSVENRKLATEQLAIPNVRQLSPLPDQQKPVVQAESAASKTIVVESPVKV